MARCTLVITALVGMAPAVAGAAPAHVMKKPGAPTAMTVVSADTALIVSWSAPTSPGTSPISGYAVSARGVHEHPTCSMTGPTSCIATGLINGRPDTFKIRAINGSGDGTAGYVAGIPGAAQNCSYVGPWANLQECNFAFTSLSGTDLTGADLQYADLEGTNLSETTLTGANLTGADLQYIGSGGVSGTPAALPAGWAVGGGYLFGPGVSLDWADLSGITFPAADLTGADLEGANLTGDALGAVTSFSTADLEFADLSGTDLQGARLAGADLSSVSSGGVTGIPASLPTGWGLAGGYLVGPDASLSWGTDLAGATFPAADLTGADLEGATVTGAELAAVTSLEDANLQFADFAGSDLTGEDLTGADLAGANFAGADLTGVTWSDTTCPDGSNSDGDGGTCIGYGI